LSIVRYFLLDLISTPVYSKRWRDITSPNQITFTAYSGEAHKSSSLPKDPDDGLGETTGVYGMYIIMCETVYSWFETGIP